MSETQRYGPQDEPFSSPYGPPPEPRRKSGCLKIFVLTAIVCVVGMVACCVGGLIYLNSMVVRDPAEARRIADEMVDWKFNAEFSNLGAIDAFFIRWVIMLDPETGNITMVQSRLFPDEASAGEAESQMRSQFNMGAGQEVEETRLVKSGEKTIEVRGEKVRFVFDETSGVESGETFWEVTGVIPGEPYPVVVFIKLRQSAYSEAAIVERLQGIR